jgi:hypothetical protein
MDDFNVTNLYESKNEWASRLVNILTPLVSEGFTSILDESYKLCVENDEEEKYLMTFQNMISNIPSWSATTVEEEKDRIISSSGCTYMNDLITCVHVIQLKILTCVRVGHKQKPIEIDIPSLEKFVHRVYINVARRLYSNVYLFEKNILPLQIQKHNRELEMIIKECILNTVRDSIPVEEILRAYLDETTEEEITEEIREVVEEKSDEKSDSKPGQSYPDEPTTRAKTVDVATTPMSPGMNNTKLSVTNPSVSSSQMPAPHAVLPTSQSGLQFSDTDEKISSRNVKETVNAPKDIDTLERISNERRENEDYDDDGGEDKLTIHDVGNLNLDILDVNDINKPIALNNEFLIPDIEVL